MTAAELAIAALAALGAGMVNALAGGGTLISFPALLALGVPPIAANITNAVALSPGYFGATLAQRTNLHGQRARLWICIPAAIVGGLAGGMILLRTHERTFQALVPYMLFVASLLLALQNRVRAAVVRRLSSPGQATRGSIALALPVALTGVYGGFFTAGMSVIVLAVLGLTLDDTLTRLNALKQAVAFSVNIAAAVFFLFSGQVIWVLAAAMAAGAMLGGVLGGRLVTRMKPDVLRWIVVCVGLALAIYYWLR
ncbi:MAG TPA: sulfite exporter TauE/SafE family protein [Povalibacter sp.]|nr:sulfite exporter TauE/SafE family protein [Povalibacter sp.]